MLGYNTLTRCRLGAIIGFCGSGNAVYGNTYRGKVVTLYATCLYTVTCW